MNSGWAISPALAAQLGANAVVGVRFEVGLGAAGPIALTTVAFGTAVWVEYG